MAAYYNEIDLYAAEWLRNLIKAGHIADGEVDTRSIIDVKPEEIKDFDQCHFFAGIAGWSHALRLSGWKDDRKIWTGSCPCQPFSVAGQGKGTDDPRHLWPHFFRLIRGCRPPVVMGEQVAGAAGYGWLDGVRSDLESEDYAIEAVDTPACSVNAPHIRSRLYWIAMDNTQSERLERRFDNTPKPSVETRDSNFGATSCDPHDMADANNARWERRLLLSECARERFAWSDGVEWRRGADGKTRRVKSGLCLLAHGVPARVGKLRAYGNAIVPQIAAEVIKAFMEETESDHLHI